MKRVFTTIISLLFLPLMTFALSDEVDEIYVNESTYKTNFPNAEAPILIPKPQVPQELENPFGWASLRNEKINLVKHFKSTGHEYDLLFTSRVSKDKVGTIYIIPVDSKGSKKVSNDPPVVRQLIYHDIGKDKEFCGAVIDTDIYNEKDNYKGTIRRELKLPDDVAQEIIDLLTNHSKFENETTVKIKEVSYAALQPVKIYE